MAKLGKKSRRGGLVARMLFGPLLILGSLVGLWLNEGRINYADVARTSQVVAPDSRADAAPGQLLAVTGELATSDPIGDDLFLRPGEYALLERTVEMFSWVEEEESDDEGTYYTYDLSWTDDPQPASNFEDPSGHQNPAKPYDSALFAPQQVWVGRYQLDPFVIEMPQPRPLSLSYNVVYEGPYTLDAEYVFQGSGTPTDPLLGDVRISFGAVPAGALVTILAEYQDGQLRPHVVRGNSTLYRVLEGTLEQAISQLDTEYRFQLWMFRLLGLVLMWVGFALLFSPINALLGLIPGGDQVGCLLTGGISLALALPLALATILVSFLLHNLWVLVGLLALIALAVYFWQRARTA